jgi:hypothetical protein
VSVLCHASASLEHKARNISARAGNSSTAISPFQSHLVGFPYKTKEKSSLLHLIQPGSFLSNVMQEYFFKEKYKINKAESSYYIAINIVKIILRCTRPQITLTRA